MEMGLQSQQQELEELKKKRDEENARLMPMDKLIADIFSSENGQRLIRYYMDMDYESDPKGLSGETLAYIEGRRSLIRDWVHIIKLFNQQKGA